jgi:hypothetical protein
MDVRDLLRVSPKTTAPRGFRAFVRIANGFVIFVCFVVKMLDVRACLVSQ